MDYGLEIQRRLEKATNYNRWILQTIQPYLGSRILEVGCSIGNFTQYFLDCSLVVALDVSEKYLDILKVKYDGRANLIPVHCSIDSPDALGLKDYALDTAVVLNVLEHVKDDEQALRNIFQALAPSGRLLMLVPAFPVLYGAMDLADDHYRRYSRRELGRKVTAAGFNIRKMGYMNFLGFFGWFINGRIFRRSLLPKNQLAVFNRMVPLVAAIERRIPPPIGQSIYCIAQKP
jgi:SAM-dependent methyltransferase